GRAPLVGGLELADEAVQPARMQAVFVVDRVGLGQLDEEVGQVDEALVGLAYLVHVALVALGQVRREALGGPADLREGGAELVRDDGDELGLEGVGFAQPAPYEEPDRYAGDRGDQRHYPAREGRQGGPDDLVRIFQEADGDADHGDREGVDEGALGHDADVHEVVLEDGVGERDGEEGYEQYGIDGVDDE